MAKFLIILSAISILAAAFAGKPLFIVLVSVVMLLYLISITYDSYDLVELIELALDEKPVTKEKEREPLVTSLYARALRSLETLSYRINSLRWQVDTLSSDQLRQLPDFISRNKHSSLSASQAKEDRLFALVLEEAKQHFRADALSIVWSERPKLGLEDPSVVSIGISGSRFCAELSKFMGPFFVGGGHAIFGRQRVEQGANLAGSDFGLFGFTEVVSYPFEYENVVGAFWLGYRGYQTSTALELKLAKHLVFRVAEEIPAIQRLHELTDRVTEAETSSREKSEFLAHMSHDIRSPLNNIRACLNLLSQTVKDPESLDTLAIARGNCDNMTELLSTILDFARHKAGKLVASKEVFDLRKEARAVVESFLAAAKDKGLTLSFAESLQGSALIEADRTQLKRVLSNLISNALKFTDSGTISVKVIESLGETKGFTLAVSDTGPGLKAHEKAQLFMPFVRHHEGKEGIGLGLALTRALVTLNGGEISVESDVGKGATFSVVFPQATSAAKSQLETSPREVKSGESIELALPAPVLLVDDDEQTLDTVGALLERAGVKVLKANQEGDAIGIINLEEPSFIVADLFMNRGGARKILQYLAEKRRKIPVIIVSGSDDPAVKEELIALGAQAVLLKPLDLNALVLELRSGESAEKKASGIN